MKLFEGWVCFYLGLDVSLLYEADVHVKFKRIERSKNFQKFKCMV